MKIHRANSRIVFYRNKKNPDYYLLYSGRYSHNSKEMLYILNNIGKYENTGYEQVKVELAYVLETDNAREFLSFIAYHISSDYLEHSFYSGGAIFAWCKLENYEPEKWQRAFDSFKRQEIKDLNEIQMMRQMALF
jgi:hypothetical protein